MQGRGRALLSLAFALLLAFGCGGRTDALYGEDDDGYPTSGTSSGGASAGQPGRAGASSRSGAPGVAGASSGGGASFGGTPTGGHGGVATAGAGGVHTAGVGGVHTAGVGGIASGGEGGAEPQECVSCLQESCTDELVQCFSDSGCFAIFRCVGLAGCTGLDCYTPQKCKKVIDQFGGPTGPSMQAVLGTLTCAVSSGCQCQ